MERLKEYDEQLKVDFVVWKSLPMMLAFWGFFISTAYIWKIKNFDFDFSSTVGLCIGIVIWIIFRTGLNLLGVTLIHTNLWHSCGLGCLAKLIGIPLSPYFGIVVLLYWAYLSKNIELSELILGIILGWLNWLTISYLEIR